MQYYIWMLVRNMLVKDKIAYGRQRKGLSTAQLAEMVGVNQGTINRYESGNIKTIPVANLQKIASILGTVLYTRYI